MSTIRTLQDLHESSPYAWPGGYPVAFYDGSGDVLCYDCAEEELFNEANEDDPAYGLHLTAEVEDDDQQYYGGVQCDACHVDIVTPRCPECGNDFVGKRTLHADNVDASRLCFDCAVKLVQRGIDGSQGAKAVRRPGEGIMIANSRYSPWYAPVGTIYCYR